MSKHQQEQEVAEQEHKGSVEEAFAELSTIIEEMEKPEITLEASMQHYKRGMELLNQCKEVLEQMETEMITLTEEGEMPDGEIERTRAGSR